LHFLRYDESARFSHVTIGDESWFLYRYQFTHYSAKSRMEVPPRTKITDTTKRVLAVIFFTGTKLLVLNVLPRERKFTHNHFPPIIAPELSKKNTNAKRRVGKSKLAGHRNNPMCHNWRKIREYFTRQTITRVSHPVYSPSDF
jgi:hypothetical protein